MRRISKVSHIVYIRQRVKSYYSFQMPTGIPYFSNLNIQRKPRSITPAQTSKKFTGSPVIGLGLPRTGPLSKSTLKSQESHLSQIFPEIKTQPQGLLAAAETSAVIDRQFAEVNKSKFLDLASSETVKNFSRLAQTTSDKFNPLKPPTQQRRQNISSAAAAKPKKRRKDIFD
jgi:hypothetical protein